MQFEDIEPLEPTIWFRRFKEIATWSLDDAGSLERALRHAFHLVQLAPRPLRNIVCCCSSEEEFESLLEAGAYLSAAFDLLGNQLAYEISGSTGGDVISVQIACGYEEPCRAVRSSPAAAVLAAWFEHVAALDVAVETIAAIATRPPLHRGQFAPRRRRTEH